MNKNAEELKLFLATSIQKAAAEGDESGGKSSNFLGQALSMGILGPLGAAEWMLEKSWPLALAAPIMAGVPAGIAASKLTSPSEQELSNIEKEILLSKLRQGNSELQRMNVVAKADEKEKASGHRPKEIRALL